MEKKRVFFYFFSLLGLIISTSIIIIVWYSHENEILEDPTKDQIDNEIHPYILIQNQINIYGCPYLLITFQTSSLATYILSFGIMPKYNESNIESFNRTQHTFLLSNLIPNTRYSYRINESSIFSFKTPQNNSNTFKIAFGGDAHFGSSNQDKNATQNIFNFITNPMQNYDLFFSLGDMVDSGLNPSDWTQLMDTYAELQQIPMGHIIGNHETLITGENNFRKNYCPINYSSPLYFHYTINRIHIIGLNLQWGNESNDKLQQEWIKNTLNSIPKSDWIIILSHAFIYSSGVYILSDLWADDPILIAEFEDLFNNNGVDLVISGHNHHMEYLVNKNVTYTIAGSLGGKLEKTREVVGSGSQWYSNENHGFLEIEIQNTNLKGKFLDPTQDNSTLYQFEIENSY